MTELIKERLKAVPKRPGCYLMRDRRGAIIYVGKAKDLRKRVHSYFRPGARHPPKVRSMVDTVWDFEYIVVKNEAESLLTEASLIKKHKPHFNILMRDDKRYLALRADPEAVWPRFTCCRIVRDDGALYFGPFPSSPVVRSAKDFVEKMDGKYDAHIARGGTNVSGGQKQRLAIARAIARDPEIYIFDDSFSALDYKTDAILRNELKKYTKDATSMIVAQRKGTIIHADTIVVLDEGECVGIGTHKELLKTCDVYKEIALSQLSEEELKDA